MHDKRLSNIFAQYFSFQLEMEVFTQLNRDLNEYLCIWLSLYVFMAFHLYILTTLFPVASGNILVSAIHFNFFQLYWKINQRAFCHFFKR